VGKLFLTFIHRLKKLADEKQQVLGRLGVKEKVIIFPLCAPSTSNSQRVLLIKDTIQVYDWLQQQQHRALFQKPVRGPVAAEVSCRDAAAAKFLENALNRFSMTVCLFYLLSFDY
jgi:hypothetical protein